jgi:hypothetical protein
MHHEEDIAMA